VVVGGGDGLAGALKDKSAVSFDNAGHALGLVDRAAGRLPALGTMTERARVSYLLTDDGIARLMHHYTLLSEPQ